MKNINEFNYEHLKYFVEVAKRKNLTSAAQSLGITQSALSQAMKKLENDLGVTLFHRNTRGLILTKPGEMLFASARPAKEAFNKAIIKTIQTSFCEDLKTFSIVCSETIFNFYILPCISQILEALKGYKIEFVGYQENIDVVPVIQNGKYDLILMKTSTDFYKKEINCDRIETLDYVIAYNPKYHEIPANITFEDLKKYRIIVKKRTGKNDSSWVEYSFPNTIICKSDDVAGNLIAAGAGIGIIPKAICEKLELKYFTLPEIKLNLRNIVACYDQSHIVSKKIVQIISACVNKE